MKVQWDIKILIWVSNYKNVIKINDLSIIKAIQPSQGNLKPEKGKLDCNYIFLQNPSYSPEGSLVRF